MIRPPQRRSRAALQRIRSKESARTILVALAANVFIAIAKLISGLISGSTALLAESAHSLADATNEVFLGIRCAVPPSPRTIVIRWATAASDSSGHSWRRSLRF
jgi:hypothetical protein